MKPNKTCNVTVFAFALALALTATGCKKYAGVTPLTFSPVPGATEGTTKPTVEDGVKQSLNPTDVASSDSSLTNPDVRRNWPRDREIFKAATVHFDYDSSVIKSEEKSKLATVADYIKAHPMDALEIEGHCDVRGTEEYNRSLGERRALALREELVSLGVEPSRIDTVSYGEDRPADTGHDEAAYRKNRRGEFVLEKHQTLAGLSGPLNNDAIK